VSKKKVLLVQVNHRYGKQIFLPYSVGLLRAYAESIPEIREAYEFLPFIYEREDIDELFRNSSINHDPDVIGLSCYIWNWEWTRTFGRMARKFWPDVLIVLGGPHIPANDPDFFQREPWADTIVHYEGEETFAKILMAHDANPFSRGRIPGTSDNAGPGWGLIKNPPAERITDLDKLPSPYLTGMFDDLLREPYQWQALSETHRGCPFSCAFCDWGSAVFQKVRKFSDERITAELDWCGHNRIELLYNCDANFAMFERDVAYVRRMAECKRTYGFPSKFRAAYAKNSGERVFEVSRILNDAGLSKGTTLSFQSMNEETLGLIKRSNIKMNNFKDLVAKYRIHNIPTYTELIIGLPGETYDSFANGIEQLLDAGCHDGLSVYTCLAEGSSIYTINGSKAIEDIDPGEQILGWDEFLGKRVICTASRSVYNGRRRTWKLTHDQGSVIATHDHRIFTTNGWRKLCELKEGDQVLCKLRGDGLEKPGQEVLLQEVLARIGGVQGHEPTGPAGREAWEEQGQENSGGLGYPPEEKMSVLWGAARQDEDGSQAEHQEGAEGQMLFPTMPREKSREDQKSQAGAQEWSIRLLPPSKSCELESKLGQEPNAGTGETKSKETSQVDGEILYRSEVGSSPHEKIGSCPEQIREENNSISQEEGAAVRLYGGLQLLGSPERCDLKQEPGFCSREQEASVGNTGPRNLLAPGQQEGPGGVGFLPRGRLESVHHLGGRSFLRPAGRSDSDVCWSTVRAIEFVGTIRVYDLLGVTPTQNFFADGVLVHNCELLPNSEMSQPEYREKHGIKSVNTPQLFYHASPAPDPHTEKYELVIGTNTLDPGDWLDCQMFAWAVQAFHCMYLTRAVAMMLRHNKNMGYRQFYEALLDWANLNTDTILGKAYKTALNFYERMREGKTPTLVDKRFGDVSWPPEEFAFLQCVNSMFFWPELVTFIETLGWRPDERLIDELVYFQEATTKSPRPAARALEFIFDIPNYLSDPTANVGPNPWVKVAPLAKHFGYAVECNEPRNLEQFAREVVWYGRKGGTFARKVTKLENVQ
jgi:radical SAM superfamily enzyme YgiQ (UPF0313 family)